MNVSEDQQVTNPVTIGEADVAHKFVLAQFNLSITALERVGALQPGEFDRMLLATGNTVYERLARTEDHQRIAQAIFVAVRNGVLLEEEFNIWSGRRKINGEPVKNKFEQLYLQCSSTRITRMRGTLTALIRAYQRILDDSINRFVAAGKAATSAAELLEVERQVVENGLLSLELLHGGLLDGWPTFLRSNGHFRGAIKLREFFDFRQHELPMPEKLMQKLIAEMSRGEKVKTGTWERVVLNIQRIFESMM